MAYSAPELLLIGAAQHLVLQTSLIDLPPKDTSDENCNTLVPEDNPGVEYDLPTGW